MLFHFTPSFFGDSVFGRNLIHAGSSAVSGFFFLSGFILTYAHMDSDHPGARPVLNIGRERFWAARFWRIYPAYLVAFILAAPFDIVQFRASGEHYGAFFANRGLSADASGINSGSLALLELPAWSLSAEALFYVLFPSLAAIFFVRKSDGWLLLGAA